MNRRNGIFILKCMLIGGLVMFTSMISGELLVRGDLFSGLARKPTIWPWIFIESAVWLLPFSTFGLVLLSQAQKRFNGSTTFKAGIVWSFLCLSMIALYKFFYFPRDWEVSHRFSEIAFGWLIPCSIILIAFVILSVKHFAPPHLKAPGLKTLTAD